LSDPYHIAGPAMISFSGGRTSGYMLHEILRAHGGELPANVRVCFANTGKERPETLRFVHECSSRWNVNVHWVEWRREGFAEVGFNSASRDGEPFAELIAWKQMPPNWQARFCTQFLKVGAMTAFAVSLGWEPGEYAEVVGLRHDEGRRLLKMYARNDDDGRRCVAPLAKAKVLKSDVMAFWAQQPFDLGLRPGWGNCDLCFLKSRGLRMGLMREWPGAEKWWVDQEASTGGFFDRRDDYSELARELGQQGDMFSKIEEDEYDAECGLHCGV
jgi:hypothetical protein